MTRAALMLLALFASACAVQGPTCPNGRVDGLETDLDCGGEGCPACSEGRICLSDVDCESGVCALNRCQSPSCHDGVENGAEAGVDCGGACAPCTVANACADGVGGAGETDVDCGGPCAPCTDGKRCARNADCAAQSCSDGYCGPACFGLRQRCGATCVDTASDPLNCGACDTPCPTGEACVAGSCRGICQGGARFCGSSCVDTGSNPQHCGGCGLSCGAGQQCIAGACSTPCAVGQQVCNGACVSISRDAQHCGGCNQPCAPGMGCIGGNCAFGCPSPFLLCNNGTVCADSANDPNFCGGCTGLCPQLPNAPRTCSGALCRLGQCFAGFADCNSVPDDGCETDLGLPASCGACGRACPGGDFCALGRCCAGLPAGTYQATCQNCEACEGLLTCICRDAAQNMVPTSIPLGPCPGGFTNCNGVLMCAGC